MPKIGFSPASGEFLQDPLELEFRILPEGRQPAKSTRYSCVVEVGKDSRSFDLYVPNLLIKRTAPKRLLMVLRALD